MRCAIQVRLSAARLPSKLSFRGMLISLLEGTAHTILPVARRRSYQKAAACRTDREPMTTSSDDQSALARAKQTAAERAAELVESGMWIGLGVGSTAVWATRHIARLLREGRLRDVTGFPCSRATEAEARALGIPLNLELPRELDLT